MQSLAQRYDFANQPNDHFKNEKTLKTKKSFCFFKILVLRMPRFGTYAIVMKNFPST